MMDTLRRERLVDELVEAYVDWREDVRPSGRCVSLLGERNVARVAESRSGCIWRRSTRKSRPPRSTPGL